MRVGRCKVIPLVRAGVCLTTVERFDILRVTRPLQKAHLLVGGRFAPCRDVDSHRTSRMVFGIVVSSRFFDVCVSIVDGLAVIERYSFSIAIALSLSGGVVMVVDIEEEGQCESDE